jgi:hypothetical protein
MCKFVNNTKNSRIDKCIKPLIENLSWLGIKTVACCCGHGKYPLSIVVRWSNKKHDYVEMVTGASIPRKRKFYKKDKKGYYYIPEAMKRVKIWQEATHEDFNGCCF